MMSQRVHHFEEKLNREFGAECPGSLFCSVAAEIFITDESIMNLCVPHGAALLPSPSWYFRRRMCPVCLLGWTAPLRTTWRQRDASTVDGSSACPRLRKKWPPSREIRVKTSGRYRNTWCTKGRCRFFFPGLWVEFLQFCFWRKKVYFVKQMNK